MLNNKYILLIDDDPDFRKLLAYRLTASGFRTEEAADVTTAKHLLMERHYDLVVLDLMMEPESGYVLFQFLKDDPKLKWIPLIVLSGSRDLQDIVQCLDLGADDYVTKPIQFDELRARVNRLLMRSEEFEQLAFHDPLTGVFNRRYFENQLSVELMRLSRLPMPLTIGLLDIDRFKAVNDNYGHPVGDLVLQNFAHTIRGKLRHTDLLARYGGEEFIVLFLNTPENAALNVIESLLETVREKPLAIASNREIHVTFSAGLAEYEAGLSSKAWTARVDRLLYDAKEAGRNRAASWNGGTDAHESPPSEADKGPLRILIADSDPFLPGLLTAQLEETELNVVRAADMEELQTLLQEPSFDLCIVGETSGDISAFEIAQLIKKHPDWSRIKVFMLFSYKTDDAIAKAIQIEADNFLVKPFSMVEFGFRLRRLLGINNG